MLFDVIVSALRFFLKPVLRFARDTLVTSLIFRVFLCYDTRG